MPGRLPQSLQLDAPHGEPPSTARVRPTDLGLGEVAANVAHYAQVKDAVDETLATRDASKMLSDHWAQFGPEEATRAAGPEGAEPGYASAAQVRYEAATEPWLTDEDVVRRPALRRALRVGIDARVAQVGQQAAAVEGARRAEPIRQQQAAVEADQEAAGINEFTRRYGARVNALQHDFDGSDPNFAGNVQAAFNEEAAAVLETVPEAARPRVQARLAAMGERAFADATQVQQTGANAFTAQSVLTRSSAAINNVYNTPSTYPDALRTITELTANLPAEHRAETVRELSAQAAIARVSSLVDHHHRDQARTELERGDYDAYLSPAQKQTLAGMVDQNTVADHLRHGEALSHARSEEAAVATTGRPSGAVTPEDEANMTEADLAEHTLNLQYAQRLSAAIGDPHSQTPQQLTERLEAARPDPASPDFASEIQVYQQAQNRIAADLHARGADPAAWAMTPGARPGPADAGTVVHAKNQAWRAAAPGPDRARLAQDYAAATLRLQGTVGGVGSAGQRIYSNADAAALAATLNAQDPAERARALQNIGGILRDFGPYGGRLARELIAAHAPAADIQAAVTAGGDPGELSPYVAARGNPATQRPLDVARDETQLNSTLQREMGPYLQSLALMPGAAANARGRFEQALIVARQERLGGATIANAARTGARSAMGQDYVFAREGWRMPASVQHQNLGGGWQNFGTSNLELVRRGGYYSVAALLANHGAGLAAPPAVGAMANMPADNRRRAYADQVRNQARWVTTADDRGLQLMTPSLNGTWTPVLDNRNRPVRVTWYELAHRGATTPRP